MNEGTEIAEAEESLTASEKVRTAHWWTSRRGPAFLDPIFRLFEHPEKIVAPYLRKGYVVADLGCGWGHYSLVLSKMVGPEGKVISVDLADKCIRSLRKKAARRGFQNIEARALSASDLSFIPDQSVDFVFANGLLCSMAVDRQSAVSEMKRILKQDGLAYISLGAAPPLGYVDQIEWYQILSGFNIEDGGPFKGMLALVSLSPAAA